MSLVVRKRRSTLVLHLHRLDRQEALPLLDSFALGHPQPRDAARYLGAKRDGGRDVVLGGGTARPLSQLSPVGWLYQRLEAPAIDDDLETTPAFRSVGGACAKFAHVLAACWRREREALVGRMLDHQRHAGDRHALASGVHPRCSSPSRTPAAHQAEPGTAVVLPPARWVAPS